MSKRAPGLPQRPRGFWQTPRAAVVPLIPFLPPRARYGEPCAGDGALVAHLADLWPAGRADWVSDIEPQAEGIEKRDALTIKPDDFVPPLWITNPPWPRAGGRGDPAISIVKHLATIAPCWALLPWDFAANDYFGRISAACSEIVPIGRVSWLGNGTPGKDNCAWFRFDACNRLPPVVRARGAA